MIEEWVFPLATRAVHTPSGKLACFDEGRGDALVFVHGLGGDFTHFEYVAPAFAGTHRVIGVDLPGCGGSHKPGRRERHTVDGHARALLHVLDALGVFRATLVGHSAGGLVCARASLLDPGRAQRLVLINSAGLRAYSRPARLLAHAFTHPSLLRRVLAPSARRILAGVFHEDNQFTRRFTERVTLRPRRELLPHVAKVMHDLVPELMTPALVDRGHLLTAPTLLVWGDRDRLVPLERVRAAAARLPAARLEVIAGCGHMPIIERPAEVVALLRGFLQAAAS